MISARLSLEVLEDRNLLTAAPIDVIGNLPPAEYDAYIPTAINFQGNGNFSDWGNEPSVAVNPLNPNQVVVSTFNYGSFIVNPPGDTRAALWYSTDGGNSWDIRFSIPEFPVSPLEGVPNDQTYAYDSNGVLHGALLTFGLTKNGPSQNIVHGTTADPAMDGQNGKADDWQWNTQYVNLPNPTRNKADQPWIGVSGSSVYVGYGFGEGDSVQARVSASSDGGATFTQDNPISHARKSWPSYNPGIRLAADQAGRVYAIFGIGDPPQKAGQPVMMHYRLNVTYDGGATWAYTSNTREGGLPIADGPSLQLGEQFGGVNSLLGNITAIAVDSTGSHIYVTYGMQDTTGADRIYLAEFHPDSSGNLVERANPVAVSVPGERAALPSVAVTDNGDLAVQYDTFANGQFHVHLARSSDHGLTFSDQDLNDFTATGIPYPYVGGNRLLGDYQGLIAVGNSVFGTFGARGNVKAGDIDTTNFIDPFFYSVSLPDGQLNSLAPVTPTGTGSGGGSGGSSGGGSDRFFGAAMFDRFDLSLLGRPDGFAAISASSTPSGATGSASLANQLVWSGPAAQPTPMLTPHSVASHSDRSTPATPDTNGATATHTDLASPAPISNSDSDDGATLDPTLVFLRPLAANW
jgi:hypothetical protein